MNQLVLETDWVGSSDALTAVRPVKRNFPFRQNFISNVLFSLFYTSI